MVTAQEAATASDPTAEKIETIVVTAEKRVEDLESVPIAMQAYTGEQLRNAGISKLTDIVRMAPNLNVVDQNSLSQHIVIRGVGTNEFFGNAPSSVGTYLDEVTLNSSYMSTLSLFDMERIEVLRGPQNSLFGRNTTGGAVNYITVQPAVGKPMDGYGTVTYGSHNLLEAEGALAAPLGDQAAMRLSGKVHERDGIWNNLADGNNHYGDEDRYALRATLLWEPGAATSVTFNLHRAQDDSQAQPQKFAGAMADNPPLRANDIDGFSRDIDWTNPTLTKGLVNVQGYDRSTTHWNDVYVGGAEVEKLGVNGAYLKIKQELQGVSLSLITSFDETHALYEEDNTGDGNFVSPGGSINYDNDVLIIDMDQQYRQFTQELRLASSDNTARLRWIAGLYYLNETSTLAQSIRFGSNGFPGAQPVAAGVLPPTGPPAGNNWDNIQNPYDNAASFSISDLRDRSVSAYGQTDFKLTAKVGATFGLRYTYDDKINPHFFAGAFDKTGINPAIFYDRAFLLAHAVNTSCLFAQGRSPPFLGNCSDDIRNRKPLRNGELGGKAALQYHFSHDVMLYGGYSRGFKSGKFDLEFLHTDDTPFPQRSLQPETLDAFELGLKAVLLDDSLVLNGALFYNIWKNQQVFNVGVSGPEFNNLPESRIYGGELEMQWVPARHWKVGGSIGLLYTRITDVTGMDFDIPVGSPGHGDFKKGYPLPLSPKLSLHGSLDRTFILRSGELSLGPSLRYQSSSKVKFSPQPPIDEYPARFLLDAQVTYRFGAERQYELQVAGDNLTAQKYCSEIQDLRGVSGSYYCVPNDGEAEFSLHLRANF
jgi:iron complex outermembrane receptor protein